MVFTTNVASLAKLDEGGTSAKTMLDVLVEACWCRSWKVIGLGLTLSVISGHCLNCGQSKEIRRVWSVAGSEKSITLVVVVVLEAKHHGITSV